MAYVTPYAMAYAMAYAVSMLLRAACATPYAISYAIPYGRLKQLGPGGALAAIALCYCLRVCSRYLLCCPSALSCATLYVTPYAISYAYLLRYLLGSTTVLTDAVRAGRAVPGGVGACRPRDLVHRSAVPHLRQ
eukprot:1870051-Rhodomonas_salina.1